MLGTEEAVLEVVTWLEELPIGADDASELGELETLVPCGFVELDEYVLVVLWVELLPTKGLEDVPGFELVEICEVCEVCGVSKVSEVRLEVLEESCDGTVEVLGTGLGKNVVVVVNRAGDGELDELPGVVKVLVCPVEAVVLWLGSELDDDGKDVELVVVDAVWVLLPEKEEVPVLVT